MKETWIRKLEEGNLRWQRRQDVQAELRRKTAAEGQEPYAIVIACSDSRVIPEQIFDAGLGELFVIRVAGNVLDGRAGSARRLRKECAPWGRDPAAGVSGAPGDPNGEAGDPRRGLRHRKR